MGEERGSMEDLVKEFWKGRKVFLTGHTGFKGGWLSLWLQALGAEVMGYGLGPPSTPNLYMAARVGEAMRSARGDLLDRMAIESALNEFAPEVVFHLAAQPIVRRSYQDPVGTFQTNVLGTVNLLECIRHCPAIRSVVVVTSDKCYENHESERPFREEDCLGGHDPYSASKACADIVASCYSRAFFSSQGAEIPGPALASARAGNVIGGGDWASDRLIPDLLRAFGSGEVALIRHPEALRPWQHVLEPLRGYLLLAQALFEYGNKFSGAWNFGPRNEDVRSVEWIVQWLAQAWGEGARWRIDDGRHAHEARVLRLDCSKARMLLGWQPRLHLEDALQLTVGWYKCFLAGGDLRSACIEQIMAYMEAPDSGPTE